MADFCLLPLALRGGERSGAVTPCYFCELLQAEQSLLAWPLSVLSPQLSEGGKKMVVDGSDAFALHRER